jgi:hypothetical protein
VGLYNITQGTLALSTNYTLTFTPGVQFEIKKLTVTVTPNSGQFKIYGSADPTLSYGFSPALIAGDSFSGALARDSGANVGLYNITQGTLALSTNYTLTFTTGVQFQIKPAVLTITADSKTKLYGAALPALTASFSGFVNGDTPASLTTPVSLGTVATASSPVGSYTITASGAVDPNYTIAFVSGTLKVNPAPLTISADSKTKIYGAALPAFTASFSGFVNGDTPASLTTPVSLGTVATASSPVGSYTITASSAVDANYTITFLPGTLQILYASGGMCDGDAGHQILQPINTDGTSVWKQGSTVPAKFRVCDANGVSIGTTGVVQNFVLYKTNKGTLANVDELTIDNSTNDLGWRFDSTAQQWIFNMSTKLAPINQTNVTYYFQISLNDGSSIFFQYGLK